jgi:hypothetical protein
LIAIMQLRLRIGRTWSSVGWLGVLAMMVVSVLLPAQSWPFAVLGILFGAAFVAAGIELLRENSEPPAIPVRSEATAPARPGGTQ